MTAARVITIVGDYAYIDGGSTPYQAGPIGLLASLPSMLHRAAMRLDHSDGVVLLGKEPAEQLGLWRKGRAPEPGDEKLKAWPGLEPARADGWSVSGLAAWMTFRRDTYRVRVCVLPWLDPANIGGLAGEEASTDAFGANLARFHEVLGVPFHTHPGVVGLSLLRDVTGPRLRTEPYWKPDTSKWPAGTHGCESDLLWTAPCGGWPLGRYVHAYDARRAYLAAARALELATTNLRHEHAPDYSPKLAGYWQIPRPAWNDPNMPHPCGYQAEGERPGAVVWVTTPTMELLAELDDQGVIAMPKPLAGYLGFARPRQDGTASPLTTRVLREWSALLDQAARDTMGSEADEPVNTTIKHIYAAAIGQMNTETGRLYRPDWRHAVIAKTRANLWRKMWRIGHEEARWPMEVHRDSIRYTSDDPDPVSACPRALTLGTALGEFRTEPDNTVDRGAGRGEGADHE